MSTTATADAVAAWTCSAPAAYAAHRCRDTAATPDATMDYDANMKRYETPRHPVAFGVTAVALTLITFAVLVAAPAGYGAAEASPAFAAAGAGRELVAVAGTCARSGAYDADRRN